MRRRARSDTPCDYEIIGEHLVDPTQLLAIDRDRRFYSLNLQDGQVAPVELTDEWSVDLGDSRLRHHGHPGAPGPALTTVRPARRERA